MVTSAMEFEQFSPDSVHQLQLASSRNVFTDILLIARELTPSQFAGVFDLNAESLIDRIIESGDGRFFCDPQVLQWCRQARTFITTNEATLATCTNWYSLFSDLKLLIAGQAAAPIVCRIDWNTGKNSPEILRVPGYEKYILAIETFTPTTIISERENVQVIDGTTQAKRSVAGFELIFCDGPFTLEKISNYKQLKSVEFDENWRENIKAAREYVGRNTIFETMVGKFARCLGLLVASDTPQTHLSISSATMPNMIFMSFDKDEYVLAEAMVHESDHNLLYALSDILEIWTSDNAYNDATYWSPWRTDRRPVDGIMRGASAFLSVSEWLESQVRRDVHNRELFQRLLDRLLKTSFETQLALEELEKYAGPYLSTVGAKFFATLLNRLEKLQKKIDSNIDRDDMRYSKVREEVEKHREIYG